MVTIRPARPDDAEAIRDVAREAWHAVYDDLLGSAVVDRRVDEWYDPDALVESMNSPGSFSVAVDGDAVVGFVHLGPPGPEAPAPFADADVAVLYRLYVRPARWRAGVGTELLTAAERRVDPGFDRVRCAVYADNDVARSFFADRGFEPVETLETDPPELILQRAFEGNT